MAADTFPPPKFSQARFGSILREQAKVFRQNLDFRNAMLALAGSDENAQAFFQLPGVGIGAFAKMVNLPVSTVRHYIRLGLIEPWEVEGRYRFQPVNVRQAQTVRMWRELRMSLEEIVRRSKNSVKPIPR